ncbi:peptidase M42 [Rubneribacter badeniensis]|uniref:Peptidase M42 n=1 Tax=Rubneribacter badeniensis TaxID=2070688 RepID=A0A2K2U7S7_9ACTN|nr:M42 family metallopeptidase [Rubneribacter badeniensis]PNV66383.1 peptidase M42 [Rubneribacter badeniensis]
MKNKQVKLLKRLLETPSATGTEAAVAALVRAHAADAADEVDTDVMGSVHARLKGSGAGPSLMLSAHMDEIGLMVTYVSDDGFLSVAAVGGVDAAILPGLRVDVHASNAFEPLRGVVGRKPIHLIEPDERKSVTPLDKLVIDLGLPAKKVKKLVRVGDVATFGVGFERFGANMAVSRAFDDKAGVWIGLRVLQRLAKGPRPTGDFVFAATVQEEIGVRGAETSAYSVRPDVVLAFDVTHATDYPGIDRTKHGKIVCGGGPVIARGPNINPEVFERLVAAAEAEGLPYQIEAEPGVTGTDARAIQMARGGIATGLVSVPLRYMHTPTEVVCLDDLDATVDLIVRFARDLDEGACFVPGMGGVATASGIEGEAGAESEAGPAGSETAAG